MKSTESSRAHELYRSGRLGAAIETLVTGVKARPTDTELRGHLVEFLCIAGELERAEQQLDTLARLDSSVAVGASLLKAQVQAERWRQQFHLEGRVPEFLSRPAERLQLCLRASILIRQGELNQASDMLASAEAQRPRVALECGGQQCEDFRDLDDLLAGVFEVLTSTGKYYWIPMDSVRTVQVHKPTRAIDLFWPRATLAVEGGPEGDVFLPAIYAPYSGESTEAHMLGRATDWSGEEHGLVRGHGLRTFLCGDETRTVLDLGTLQFRGAS